MFWDFENEFTPIEVGSVIDHKSLAYINISIEDVINNEMSYYEDPDATYYDFGTNEPWDSWVIVGKKDDLFLVVPFVYLKTDIGKNEACLRLPTKVKMKWHDEICKDHISEIFALAGFSHWRTKEELERLTTYQIANLLPNEAKKVRQKIFKKK